MRMRNTIFSFILAFVLIVGSMPARANRNKNEGQNPAARKAIGSSIWQPVKEYRCLLSGGYSSELNDEGYMGAKGMVDYFLGSSFSVGVEGSLYFGGPSFSGNRTPSAGLRGSYHFIVPKKKHYSPWGLYSGLNTGLDFGRGDKSFDELDPYVDVHVGARYLVSDTWTILGELSGRNAIVGLGLRF